MASSINASTSGAGGVITTADNSGVLNLQSGGTTVATVSSTGFSTPANQTINTANTFGFKNRIINGAMTFDQRNAGASVTPTTGQYTVDRWKAGLTQASKFTVQQNAGSVTPATGFTNYLGITSSSAYSVGSGDIFLIQQVVEGSNLSDLAWGTANAKTVTLSAWVYSSLTGTFGGAISNGSRSYPFSYTISSANTWTQISVTIPGDTSGTWVTNSTGGTSIRFGLGGGSTYSGTAGAWAAGDLYTSTGAVSVVGTNGATFYITGVQLEVGSQATSFDFRDYGRELILCQRYYQKYFSPPLRGVTPDALTAARMGSVLPVVMRTSPTTTYSGTLNVFDGSGVGAISSINIAYATTTVMEYDLTLSNAVNVGRPAILYQQGGTANFALSAEL